MFGKLNFSYCICSWWLAVFMVLPSLMTMIKSLKDIHTPDPLLPFQHEPLNYCSGGKQRPPDMKSHRAGDTVERFIWGILSILRYMINKVIQKQK